MNKRSRLPAFRAGPLAAATATLIACTPAIAAAPVTSLAELEAAIAAAKGGETILIAPGDYGDVRVFDRAYSSPVTLRSANAQVPARLRRVRIIGSRNVRVENVSIGYPLAPTEPVWTRMAEVIRSRGVCFSGVGVHSSLDGNPQNDGWGLNVRDSQDVEIRDSEFQQLVIGILAEGSDGLIVRNNDFHDLQRDGADFAGMRDVLIEDNRFRDFFPKEGDHPDAIQFWSARQTRPSTDIVIRNNVVMQGRGGGLQAILLGNELALPYKNVTITNNLVYSRIHYHGITVYDGDSVSVTGNTVVSPSDDAARFWIGLINVTNGTVARNVTDEIVLQKGTVARVTDNIVLTKDRSKKRLLPALDHGPAATPAGLIMAGYGYQGPAGR